MAHVTQIYYDEGLWKKEKTNGLEDQKLEVYNNFIVSSALENAELPVEALQ